VLTLRVVGDNVDLLWFQSNQAVSPLSRQGCLSRVWDVAQRSIFSQGCVQPMRLADETELLMKPDRERL
jgi:hypothetical protein